MEMFLRRIVSLSKKRNCFTILSRATSKRGRPGGGLIRSKRGSVFGDDGETRLGCGPKEATT